MSGARPRGVSMSRKGDALPPPEPAIKVARKPVGRRVGTVLPNETYVRFKAHVARSGATGEMVIRLAIERLLDPAP